VLRASDTCGVTDDPGAIGKLGSLTLELLETDAVWVLRMLHH